MVGERGESRADGGEHRQDATARTTAGERGSPYAPHTPAQTRAMLDAIGVDDEEALFDVPGSVRFDGAFGIEPRSEADARREIEARLSDNDDLVEFLGRGHYDHYVPSLVDHLADRSEFLTSYTQYQPEVAQGFLQALFEYQSMIRELTGLPVANCSMYDAATALGEAATLAARVRGVDGHRVLVPDLLADGRRSTLENYVAGTDLVVETYPTDDANVDRDGLDDRLDDDVAMVYAESPTVRGTVEEHLGAVGDRAADHGALFCLGSDPVSLAIVEEPAAVGADVVVGDAATLGLGAAYGMGLGMFATREEYLRQVPGRLVGAGEEEVGRAEDGGTEGDAATRRAYTLTLQTREQHIRKERATSNICTNQAWVALRTAMHAASLGPEGLVDLAGRCVREAADLADRLDALSGVAAPVHDRHHLREFVAHTDQPAPAVADDLVDAGYAVHVVGDHEVQVCVTDANAGETDGLVRAFEEAAR